MTRRRDRKGATPEEREESLERLRNTVIGPAWAQVAGMDVKSSTATKRYTCPYCNGMIEVGTRHVVAFPDDRLDDRRHYHTPCWAKHSRRQRP